MGRFLALATSLLLPLAAAAQDPSAKGAGKQTAPAQAKPDGAKTDGATTDGAKTDPSAAQRPESRSSASSPAAVDPEELRRQILEEVRRELQKTRDDVKQETAWVEHDSQARAQDGEILEAIKQRVNFFQPHGYLRLRGEFLNNFDLGRGADRAGYTLFPRPYIGTTDSNHSISDANFRFRFAPVLEVSEDLSIHVQADILDNIVLGSGGLNTPFLDNTTPLALLNTTRAGSPVNVKRVWGRVNTQVGEFLFGRMPYHWGMGILHNDGNCLDCDYGDTYDRLAFTPRDYKGLKLQLMFDLLDKGVTTTGEHGELGRSVSVDTLVDGYRLGLQVTHLDSEEEVKRKLANNEWVVNYGAVADVRTQGWDTPVTTQTQDTATLGGFSQLRADVVQRSGKLYQPDAFLTVRRKKVHLDLEIASTFGSIGTRSTNQGTVFDPLNNQGITFFQWGGAMQADLSLLPADALQLGVELGAASGDKGVYGFGARPWRSGSGAAQGVNPDGSTFNATAPGDIDGPHFNFTDPAHSHGHVNNFVFNRAFNVDMILWRNLITAVTGAFFVKPSLKYRPTGRKSGGGDDSGFELTAALIYSQAFYPENTPGQSSPLGLEANVGITYDTSDRLHVGLEYGLLLPFAGLKNLSDPSLPLGATRDASIAHAVRFMTAIPF